jgi:hypothetical protein
MIGLPNLGQFHREVTAELIKLALQDHLYELEFNFHSTMPYEACVNEIIADFLNGEAGYLLLMDSDNPPTKNVLDFVDDELDMGVIVFPTPMDRGGDGPIWNVVPPPPEKKELRLIEWGGSGCMLIRRDVLESVRAPFMRRWKADGTVAFGADWCFCHKAREAGFEIWSADHYPCRHYKDTDITRLMM